jgi:hypothetical protein
MSLKFDKWIDTLIEEKGYDTEHRFEIEGESGINSIPLGCVVDTIKQTTANEQTAIKNMLVKIDFKNGDCLDYFRHLAWAIAL